MLDIFGRAAQRTFKKIASAHRMSQVIAKLPFKAMLTLTLSPSLWVPKDEKKLLFHILRIKQFYGPKSWMRIFQATGQL